jgi:hypothetical protein
MPLEAALALLRKDYRPLLILYPGPMRSAPGPREGPEEQGKGLSPALADAITALRADLTGQKTLKRYLQVDLAPAALGEPYPLPPGSGPPAGPRVAGGRAGGPGDKAKATEPPSAGERLGIVDGVPALLVLDFRERVARRYEKLPRREKLIHELEAIGREEARLAEAARRVEKVLEKAEYSYALKETRQAVLLVVPLDDRREAQGLDPVLRERTAKLIERYKKDGRAAIGTGEALEAERRYLEAVQAYRKAALDFPFPEIVKDANRLQGAAFRKAQVGQ